MQGDREAVRTLLKQAADVNAAQGDGMTALHWAAMNGDAELAQMLLFAGANVRATTRLGAYTPLILAAKQGQRHGDRGAAEGGRRRQERHRQRHDAADAGGRGGRRRRGQALLVENGAEVNAKEPVRGRDAADVRGGVQSRRR